MYGIIYRYTSPSGKSYIGQTIHPRKRFLEHKRNSNNGTKTKFYDAVRKYGFENFKYEVLVTVDFDDKQLLKQKLDWFEKFYIRKYHTLSYGYNMTEGGDSTIGYEFTEEHRKKLSDSLKGKIVSEETKRKMSLSIKDALSKRSETENKVKIEKWKNTIKERYNNYIGDKNPNYGKHNPHTEELKQHFRELFSGDKNPMYGVRHTEEAKRKMSEARKGKHRVYDNPEHTKWHFEK